MHITNFTDYHNLTDDYNNTLSLSVTCTNNDNIDIIIPTLLLTKPCGSSFLCLMSLMVYTLIKPLVNNNR